MKKLIIISLILLCSGTLWAEEIPQWLKIKLVDSEEEKVEQEIVERKLSEEDEVLIKAIHKGMKLANLLTREQLLVADINALGLLCKYARYKYELTNKSMRFVDYCIKEINEHINENYNNAGAWIKYYKIFLPTSQIPESSKIP